MNTKQIVSFTNNADRTPVVTTRAMSNGTGLVTRALIARTKAAKPPARRRCATSTIIPNSSTIVRKSTAWIASSKLIAPVTTIRMAPMIAAPVRSTRRPGALPTATTT